MTILYLRFRCRRLSASWAEAKAFAQAVCKTMADAAPDRYVINMAKKLRTGKIFLDYLRNDRTATAVAPLSPRGRPGAPVSMPVTWAQVKPGLNPMDYTIRTVPALLKKTKAWDNYCDAEAPLADAIKRLHAQMADYLLGLDTEPMEAKSADELPAGGGWQFEPKWDGFRCLIFKAGESVDLHAKSGKSLSRYFPEMVEAVRSAKADNFVLDGELTVPLGDTLSFGALQDRTCVDFRPRRHYVGLGGSAMAIYDAALIVTADQAPRPIT